MRLLCPGCERNVVTHNIERYGLTPTAARDNIEATGLTFTLNQGEGGDFRRTGGASKMLLVSVRLKNILNPTQDGGRRSLGEIGYRTVAL